MNSPTVFISYSWDNEPHKEWILRLADELISKYGIDVILDQYELSAGKDLTYFMETSIEKADKVLLILTPNYKLKSENREGGVGYEYSMISQELFDIQAGNNKFIPILKVGTLNTSCPKYVKSKIYHDMTNDLNIRKTIFDLARLIYDKPAIEKPQKGSPPDFKSPEYDPILEMVNELNAKEAVNNSLNQKLQSEEGVRQAQNEIEILHKKIKEKTELYNLNSAFKFIIREDYPESIVIFCNGFSVRFYWRQAYRNTIDESVFKVTFWNGLVEVSSKSSFYFRGEEPSLVKEKKLNFNLDINGKSVWSNTKTTSYTDELIHEAFSFILENIRKQKEEKYRKK